MYTPKSPTYDVPDEHSDEYTPKSPTYLHPQDSTINSAGDGPIRKRHTKDFENPVSRQQKFSRSTSYASNNRFAADGSMILQEESRRCIAEMSRELSLLDNSRLPDIQHLTHSHRLLSEEINKLSEHLNPDWLDVSARASIKVIKSVLLPRARPGHNVIGRLFGFGGATMKQICQNYKCRISVAGAGSTKNPTDEARLLSSGDPRYSHLSCPLHAELSFVGPPHLAYARLAQVLDLLHKLVTTSERFEYEGIVFESSPANIERKADEANVDSEHRMKVSKAESKNNEAASDQRQEPNDLMREIEKPVFDDYPAYEDDNQVYEEDVRRF